MADAMPITPLEEKLARLLAGALPDQREIAVDGKDVAGAISGSYLQWFFLRAIPAAGPAITRFELSNVTISGDLDLRGANVTIILRFVNCVFPGTIYLTDAKVIGIDFVGGTIEVIAGDRLSAEGSLRLLAPKFVGQKPQGDLPPKEKEKLRVGTRIKQIRLCGAHIHGNLDFRGSELGGDIKGDKVTRPLFADGITVDGNVLISKGFSAVGEVCFNGSNINRNLDCSGAKLVNHHGYSLSAAGAKIGGAVLLCKQYWRDKDDDAADLGRIFESEGVVRFDGAKISGDLNCQNGKFTATAFAVPEWRPDKDKADEAKLDSTAGPTHAIKANGLEVGGDVSFGSTSPAEEDSFDINGTTSMIGAQIGGDLYFSSARLNFPGEETVVADVITVNGTVFIDNTYSNGVLRFVQATLKQGLSVSGATFDVTKESRHWADDKTDTDEDLEGPACGVYADFAQIAGTFTWQEITKKGQSGGPGTVQLWLRLFGSSGSAVQDDEQSWTILDRSDITDAQYASIGNLSGADVAWRLRELDRQYALYNQRSFCDLVVGWRIALTRLCRGFSERNPKSKLATKMLTDAVKRFKPQPYLQLAKTYRAAGYQSAARRVLVRLERNETRYSDLSLFAMIWRWLLDLTIQYGHALLRPIMIIAVWIVVSATVFQLSFDQKKIVAVKESPASQSKPRTVPEFNSLIFAIDTLLPIVDLNQKKTWTVNPLSTAGVREPGTGMSAWAALAWVWHQIPEFGGPALLIFNTFFGWLMTTLFVAGVSGLIRPRD